MKHLVPYKSSLLESAKPTIIKEYYENDRVSDEKWHLKKKDGSLVLHRKDGPAWIRYSPLGKIASEAWYHQDKSHRVGAPADIWYADNGEVSVERWRRNDHTHRQDGPAYIEYYPETGRVRLEAWYHMGKSHREDGPDATYYYEDGSLESQTWSWRGKYHREDGPAWIHYNRDGSVAEEEYYLNGIQIHKRDPRMAKIVNTMKIRDFKELGFSDEDIDLIKPLL
jgi:antitoxin component YwqK of YwqJK toxin-antitoxin module